MLRVNVSYMFRPKGAASYWDWESLYVCMLYVQIDILSRLEWATLYCAKCAINILCWNIQILLSYGCLNTHTSNIVCTCVCTLFVCLFVCVCIVAKKYVCVNEQTYNYDIYKYTYNCTGSFNEELQTVRICMWHSRFTDLYTIG